MWTRTGYGRNPSKELVMKFQNLKKLVLTAGAAAAMTILFSASAFAVQTVSSMRITFTDKYEDPGVISEPEISCSTSGVEIESVEWSKDVEKWKPGTKVTATLTLSSREKEFSSSYGAKTCQIYGASLSKAVKTDDDLKVTVTYYPVVWLDSPETAGWSASNHNKAVWKKVDYATGYQIRLYRDDNYLRTIDVTGISKDLSEYMGQEGNYYYEVRAVGRTTDDAKYRKGSDYITSSDVYLDDLGDTEGNWKNYEQGKKYVSESGENISSQWYRISGSWYYFDENGYMTTGWRQISGKWYYLESDGKMATGWKQLGGKWYYLDADGSMATGWRQTNPGQWYYLNPDGSMASSTVINGYKLDASGVWVN